METLISIALLAVGALGLSLMIALVYQYASAGAALILFIILARAYGIHLPAINPGAFTFFAHDITFIIIASAGIARMLAKDRYTNLQLLWLIFGTLILISFLRGVSSYGLLPAGVELRQFFYFFSGTLYFSTFFATTTRLRHTTKLWLVAAGLLILLAGFKWLGEGISFSAGDIWDTRANMRVLDSAQTFFLAQAFLIVLFLWLIEGKRQFPRYFALLLLPAIILLQHRSVWVALLVAVFLAALKQRLFRRRIFSVVAVSVFMGVILMLLVLGEEAGVVSQALGMSATNTNTFLWRLEGWRVLLSMDYLSSHLNYLIGKPLGAGYDRFLPSFGYSTDVYSHNFYIDMLVRVGLAGLFVFVLSYYLVLRDLARIAREDALKAQLLVILLTTQLAYLLFYGPAYEQGILLGLAMSFVSRKKAERTTDDLHRRSHHLSQSPG